MKNIYFIDNESIKRTAKKIQKENQKIKYTIILDDLAKILGYDSYNQYEHYLTNIILSKETKLNNLKALTKIDSINLLLLKKDFILQLSNKGYFINDLYFIDKIINYQYEGFINYGYLNLYSYLYFLPFIHKEIDLHCNHKEFLNCGKLTSLINGLINYYKTIDINFINELINNLIQDEELNDINSNEQLNLLSKELKTRGLYYYIKSVVEDFEYEEGLLTMLILKGYSIERIEHELNIRLRNIDTTIPVFFKPIKNDLQYNYYPIIKSNITESKPFIFGRNNSNEPVYATKEELHSNISVFGLPGCGKSNFVITFIYQALMNNRGICVINPALNVYSKKSIEFLSASLNKKQDIFNFNKNHNMRLLASSIHNEKISLVSYNDNDSTTRTRNDDFYKSNEDFFEKILTNINDYFFTAKFRNKKIPFYIVVEESHNMENISEKSISLIKKLNALNIFFIFEHQVYSKEINQLCDLTVISHMSLNFFANQFNSSNLYPAIQMLAENSELIGINGPSKELSPVFSVIHKNELKKQFIIYSDQKLVEELNPDAF